MASHYYSLATLAAFAVFFVVLMDQPGSSVAEPGKHGHGHGHGHHAGGTACIVKGSYCSCHYCKCEKGWVKCKGHGEINTFQHTFNVYNI